MKKTTKTLLMLALAFFISGAALGVASLFAGFSYSEFVQNIEGGRFNLIGPGKWTGKVLSELGALPEAVGEGNTFEQSYSGVRSLELEAGRADCEIIPFDGQEWKVKGEHLNSRFSCELDDGELCIDCSRPILGFLKSENNTSKLRLYVPQDQILEKVSIETGAGAVTMPGDGAFLRCRYLDMECGVGETDIRADISELAKIEGGVGEIRMTLAGEEKDFNYKAECGVGGITIGGEKRSGLGKDYSADNNAEKDLKIECGVGSVELLFKEDSTQASAGHHAEDGAESVAEHHKEDAETVPESHEEEDEVSEQGHHEDEEPGQEHHD